MTDKIDAARINLLLGELRLPGIKLIWAANSSSVAVLVPIRTSSTMRSRSRRPEKGGLARLADLGAGGHRP
jgi:hypothetical protein